MVNATGNCFRFNMKKFYRSKAQLETWNLWRHLWRNEKEKTAEILVEIGTLLELKGENPFKTRAYANAARTIESLNEPLANLVAEKRLGEIKGIGEALEQKITELIETGRLKYYEDLKASIPPG